MASAQITPIPSSLEPDTTLTSVQYQVLFSFLDTVVPSVVSDVSVDGDRACLRHAGLQALYENARRTLNQPPSLDKFHAYMAARPSAQAEFVENVKRTIGNLPPAARLQLGRVLGFLDTRLGSLISTWSLTPFSKQPTHVRQDILKSWIKSWFPLWPMLARTFIALGKACWSQCDPLLHELNGYEWRREPHKPGPQIDFQFIDPGIETIDTDVVIVGSGCGGGVCAKVLSEAGFSVLVVDKGYYHPPDQFPMPVKSLEHIFQGGGSLSSVDGSTYTTLANVRKEWAVDEGLELFSSPEYQDCLDRVCDFIGVSTSGIRHNYANRLLLDGSKKLDWKVEVVPQNTGGVEHMCGSRCGFGCSASHKQGPAVTWLPAAGQHGARFMEGLDVHQVLFEDADGKTRARGLVGQWTSRDGSEKRMVTVKAKKVIVSAGAINSPLLLMRSGLKNPQIGANLHLHPTGNFTATFDEDIRGWEGEIITTMVGEFDNLDGQGYGTRIEACAMLPQYAIFGIPWEDGVQFKLDALKYRQSVSFVSLTRDRTGGKVSPDPDGYPTLNYTPSETDRSHILTGLAAIAKLCYVQGATELFALVPGIPPFKCTRPAGDRRLEDADFAAWVHDLEHARAAPSSAVYGSAHQMGTCRMSKTEKTGVVDPSGKLWGADDLYVADASVFPSATGTNPMITVMAIADHISRNIATSMQGSSSVN
ncbi:long-chain fatty alcohol dehydrogenase [Xylariomycetidae sp. FL2044]|nr:long-chain fatty alcohol dehydrogenase [Xylariomycetidae sp. FL2044]